MNTFNAQEHRREAIRRWHVLLALHNCDPLPLVDSSLLSLLQAAYPDLGFGQTELRRMLKYLEGHGLVLIRYVNGGGYWTDHAGAWMATVSSDGVDFVMGFGPEIPGIFRAGA